MDSTTGAPLIHDQQLDSNETFLRTLFSETHLASLSLSEYIELLRTHPTHFLTHVTRQGVRDHFGVYHASGMGELHRGFEKLLINKKMQSRFFILSESHGLDVAVGDLLEFNHLFRPEIIRKKLGLFGDIMKIRQELDNALNGSDSDLDDLVVRIDKRASAIEDYAKRILEGDLSSSDSIQNNAGSSADRLAVHMAFEDIADAQYGCELGNEIFLVMPATHIAADHQYNGFHQFTGYSQLWNDVWIWPKQNAGLNIDAGIVFIPKNTPVDPGTGSKYQIGADGRPGIYTSYFELLTHGIFDLLESSEWERLYSLGSYPKNDTYDHERQSLRDKILEYASKDPRWSGELELLFRDEYFLWSMIDGIHLSNAYGDKETITKVALQFLMQHGLYYVPAEQTISSQEYWEKYFETHPDRRPSKIVYYEGHSPLQAMNDFRASNAIPIPNDIAYPFPDSQITKGHAVELRRESLYAAMLPIVIRHIENALCRSVP